MLDLHFDHLNNENYYNWKIYIEAVLVRKGLWPIIILHVTPPQLAHCSHTNPMIILNTLADVHAPHGCSTIISLHHQLHKLCLEHSETMAAYIAHGCHLIGLLSKAGQIIPSDDLLLAITAGLPHSYDAFLISLDALSNSEYALDTIILHLINEYTCQTPTTSGPHTQAQLMTTAPSDDAMAITTPHCPILEITCYHCNQKGHY
ncbi:hypothetical protein P691DRAFT_683870 [Macrolepiota fuliginosa MF-IS2]|uniref:DUF4219 domain-containing protein n=1 Tax=Macrolepiota fuliginosa MF-IS2 TaxID=1400762 RepID=A0A9P6BXH1_9AGAR|nr:hypothetical protein P691DRAFT_683870 [Macrolepiota fuliginosa MF-IS2]